MFSFWQGCYTRGGPHDAVTPSGGVSAHLGTFLRVSLPAWECYCARGDFLGANSCPQVSSHFESVSAFLLYSAPGCPGRDFPLESYLPTGVSGAGGALHESGCPTLVLLLWPWSHLFLLFITAPGYQDLRPSHGVAPSMVFPTHGYRGTTLWLPCFYTVWSGDALVGRRLDLGDALPWRRFLLASLHLGDALRWLWLQPLTLTLT